MSESESASSEPVSFRLRRRADGVVDWFKENWRERRWFRWAVAGFGGLLIAYFLLWLIFLRPLPDAEGLLEYEPALPTMVRGIDGEIVDSYARDRRVQLEYNDFPPILINAYLAAEDKTFFSHGGIDYGGFAGAVLDYVSKIGSDDRAVGGSTITQQVAKNILVGDEYSIARKLREMVLARRIEATLSKQEILELYLNEIPLGRRSFGVQAASRAYFDKDVDDLELHQAAFLAALPKAPETYSRKKNESQAVGRRNWVLDQMADNDFITETEAAAAKAQPLGLSTNASSGFKQVDAGYFLEAVRRQLLDLYGETAKDGKNSVYAGGLWVRTSLDPELQQAGRDALRQGLIAYHGSRGWKEPIATIDEDDGDMISQLRSSYLGINYRNWRVGVVLARDGSRATIGFANGDKGPLGNLPNRLKKGDVIAAAPSGNGWIVRTIPEVSGGFVAQAPQTGRVLAMQGGFDSRLGDFNRATQAERQPGSTIKPFVYATGLDNGMTPATQLDNSSFCYYQGSKLGQKCFRGGRGGNYPMRYGLEQSQNIMTVRIATEAGMPKVVKTFENMGIGDYPPYPAFALGAGETTVLKMVNAYSALANNGVLNEPTLIDYVQDRHGKVIWRADKRKCNGCNMPEWDGSPMPRFKPSGVQAMDARTAFQVVHMLQGVVTRGTGRRLSDLDLPLFGKTGTTTGPKETWFIGGTQQYIAGTYIGFDNPRNMGGYAEGASIAAPVVKRFITDTRERWSDEPLVAPRGVRMVRVSRATGKKVYAGWPTEDPKGDIIWEAFKPDTEPPRTTRRDEVAARRREVLDAIRRARSATRGVPVERATRQSSSPSPSFSSEGGQSGQSQEESIRIDSEPVLGDPLGDTFLTDGEP